MSRVIWCCECEKSVVVLSKREEDVLRQLAKGKTTAQMARSLGLSESTVKNYLWMVYKATGSQGRVDATLYAIQHGLVKVGKTHVHREH